MLNKLETYLEQLSDDGIALAFSGGVDSSLLLAVLAKLQKRKNFRLQALVMRSALQNDYEIKEAEIFAQSLNVDLKVFNFNPFLIDEVRHNRTDRCYHCKKAFFTVFIQEMQQAGLKYLIDGTNADDLNVYRPGRQAAVELGVISPLAELGISKAQIRQMSAELGLTTASKPAVPCLATRFDYNTELDDKMIAKVAKGEKIIKELFPQIDNIRLRVHGNLARLEISEQYIADLANNRKMLIEKLNALGFDYFTLDLNGFRSGSFDKK